ncbi:hypothetical protein LXA43DRAFT_90119 [Ganoderma leucocontextum]|nr:hypothetical protein LXA43DRAFT_90119 [Ganoderma leucocontextum]
MIPHGRCCAMYDFVSACLFTRSLVRRCSCSSAPVFLPQYNMSCHDLHSGRVLDAEYEGTRSRCGKLEVQRRARPGLRVAVGLWPGPLHTTLLLLDPSSTTRLVGMTITRRRLVLSPIAAAVVRAPLYEPSDSQDDSITTSKPAATSQAAAPDPHGQRSRCAKRGPGRVRTAMDGSEGQVAEEKAKTGERIIHLPTTTQDCRGRREAWGDSEPPSELRAAVICTHVFSAPIAPYRRTRLCRVSAGIMMCVLVWALEIGEEKRAGAP